MNRRKQFDRSMIERLEGRTLLTGAGTLDETFDVDGIRLEHLRDSNDVTAITVDANGRYLLAVAVSEDNGATKHTIFTRLGRNGATDMTYGVNGIVEFDPFPGQNSIISDIVVNPSTGFLYASGFVGDFENLSSDAFVASFTDTGAENTAFNSTGIKIIDFGGRADALSAIEISGVSLFAAGTSIATNPLLGSNGVALTKLALDGSYDTTFGTGGKTITNMPFQVELAFDLKIDGLGRPVVAGAQSNSTFSQFDFLVERFTATGDLDPTFGTGGRATASAGRSVELGLGLVIEPGTNNIYAAGATANGFLPGIASPGVPTQAGGGEATESNFIGVALTSAGQPDTDFGGTGVVQTEIVVGGVTRLAGASDIVRQTDGKYVLSGGAQIPNGDSDTATVRLSEAGVLDATFGEAGTGIVVLDIGGSDGAFAMVYDTFDGTKIVEVGHSKATFNDSMVIRLDAASGAAPLPTPETNDVVIQSVTLTNIPDDIVGGEDSEGTVTVVVRNGSNANVKGRVVIDLFGSVDTTLDEASDESVGRKSKSVNLDAGETKTIKVKVNFSDINITADTILNLLARASGVGIDDSAATVTPGGTTVEIQVPAINLTGSLTPQAAKALKFDKSKTLKVRLTNEGNVDATGRATYNVFLTSEAPVNINFSPLFTTQVTKKLKKISAGKLTSQNVKLKIRTGDIAAGSYFAVIQMSLAGTDPINAGDGNIVAVVPVTIA